MMSLARIRGRGPIQSGTELIIARSALSARSATHVVLLRRGRSEQAVEERCSPQLPIRKRFPAGSQNSR